MARQLPIDELGRVLLLVAAANAFAIFEGLRPVVIVRVARSPADWSALFAASARVNLMMAALTLVVLVAARLSKLGAALPDGAFWALGASVPAFFTMMQFWSFLDAAADTVFTGMARGLGWTALYGSFAGLAVLGAGIREYAIALLAMHVVLALVFRHRLKRVRQSAVPQAPATPVPMRALLGPALNNVAFNVSAVTINLIDRAVVGATLGAAAAGRYAGPAELALRANGLVRAAVQVVLPWAARQSDRPGHREGLWLSATSLLLVVAGTACAIVLGMRDAVSLLLLGEAFRDAGDLLGLFSISVVTSVLGYACIVYLNAQGDFRTQRRLYSGAAVALVLGLLAAVRSGDLVVVAGTFLAARCADLLLVALVLRQCRPRDAAHFLALGVLVMAQLLLGWNERLPLAIALTVVDSWLLLRLWRRFGPSAHD